MEKEIIRQLLDEYLKNIDCEDSIKKRYYFHLERFNITLEKLRSMNFKGKVLEIGGYDAISKIIREEFPNNKYVNTDFELRNSFPYEDNSFDFIINTEVIEHICPVDIPKIQAFYPSGVENLLKECYRVLKQGKGMLLSTPNAISLVILQKILESNNPWFYFLHYKEYTLEQIKKYLISAGFKIKNIETTYSFIPRENLIKFEKILFNNGYSTKNRGDIIFAEVIK